MAFASKGRRRRCRELYPDCWTNTVTEFSGGSIVVWGDMSLTGKTRLDIIGGNLSVVRYWDEIWQPAVIPYVHSLEQNSVLQDDSACLNRTWDVLETTSRISECKGWNILPAMLTSVPLGTCGIRLGVLFVSEWTTLPHWLLTTITSIKS